MARDTDENDTTQKDKTMTLKDITVKDITEVAKIWQREDIKATRSVIVMADDPESVAAIYNPTTVTILKRTPSYYGRAAVERMLRVLFEEYPYTADIAKEILTPKDENNDTAGKI